MKNRNTLFRFLAGILVAAGITACSERGEGPALPAAPVEGIPLSMSISRSSGTELPLQYGLHVFSRAIGEGEYGLDSILLPLNETSRLKFDNNRLLLREYRFLFTATPTDASGLKVGNSSLNAPSIGTLWSDIRIVSQSDSLSIDNYYQVLDCSAQDILATDTLRGHLTRIVGQPVFRFFKIGTTIDDLQAIDVKTVTSIFDRIQSIRIKYENYTSALAFDAQGIPQPQSSGQNPITQEITPALDNYRLLLPQSSLDLIQADPANGGEIEGYCFLPNNGQLRTILTFTYFDTTPTCGNTGHQHEEKCYPLKKLTLSIPKQSTPGLAVEANAYTVSKAGIRCDRIIDIKYATSMDIQTQWDKN